MTEQNEWAVKMWNDTLKEVSTKGDALMDIYDSVCIVRLRQVVEWSLEEMWRIKERKNITDTMWEDYAELVADYLAAKRLLDYFGAITEEQMTELEQRADLEAETSRMNKEHLDPVATKETLMEQEK